MASVIGCRIELVAIGEVGGGKTDFEGLPGEFEKGPNTET